MGAGHLFTCLAGAGFALPLHCMFRIHLKEIPDKSECIVYSSEAITCFNIILIFVSKILNGDIWLCNESMIS